jgi:hypothetical protein
MTRIYEALEEARKWGISNGSGEVVPFPPLSPKPGEGTPRLKEPFTALYQAILMAFAHEHRKIVQFVEVTRGSGAFSLLAEFARFLAAHRHLEVLLTLGGEAGEVRRILGAAEWTDDPERVPAGARTHMETIRRHGQIPLHVARFPKGSAAPAHPLDPDPFPPVFEALRHAFDLVLMAMPAAADCQDYLWFSHNVDGIVLVLEAEKTRWQVARKVKTCLTGQGGNLLGAILNNRRYPIPEMIYAKL